MSCSSLSSPLSSSSRCETSDGTALMQQLGPMWYPHAGPQEASPTLLEVVRMSKNEVDALIRQLQRL